MNHRKVSTVLWDDVEQYLGEGDLFVQLTMSLPSLRFDADLSAHVTTPNGPGTKVFVTLVAKTFDFCRVVGFGCIRRACDRSQGD